MTDNEREYWVLVCGDLFQRFLAAQPKSRRRTRRPKVTLATYVRDNRSDLDNRITYYRDLGAPVCRVIDELLDGQRELSDNQRAVRDDVGAWLVEIGE